MMKRFSSATYACVDALDSIAMNGIKAIVEAMMNNHAFFSIVTNVFVPSIMVWKDFLSPSQWFLTLF